MRLSERLFRVFVFVLGQAHQAKLEVHVRRVRVRPQHRAKHLARIAELPHPHQRSRLDQPRVDAVLIDLQHLFSRLQRRLEFAARHLQLGQGEPRHQIIGPQFDGLRELLPRLLELAARRVRPPQLVMRHRVFRRPRHHRVQFSDGPRHFALVEQERRLQALRIVVVRIVFENLQVQVRRFRAPALPHVNLDHPFLVGRLLLRVLRQAFLVLANRRVAVPDPQIEVPDHEVCLLELLRVRLYLQHGHHVVCRPTSE